MLNFRGGRSCALPAKRGLLPSARAKIEFAIQASMPHLFGYSTKCCCYKEFPGDT